MKDNETLNSLRTSFKDARRSKGLNDSTATKVDIPVEYTAARLGVILAAVLILRYYTVALSRYFY